MSQDYNYALSTADLLPVHGNTPFGYYDNDPTFQNDAQRACFYITRRLGFGVVDVELVDFQIYAAIEEAVTTYGNEVYLYKVRENYLSIEGSETDSFLCDYNVSYFNALDKESDDADLIKNGWSEELLFEILTRTRLYFYNASKVRRAKKAITSVTTFLNNLDYDELQKSLNLIDKFKEYDYIIQMREQTNKFLQNLKLYENAD